MELMYPTNQNQFYYLIFRRENKMFKSVFSFQLKKQNSLFLLESVISVVQPLSSFLYKEWVFIELPYDPADPFLVFTQSYNLKMYRHPYVPSSPIHNSQDMETV